MKPTSISMVGPGERCTELTFGQLNSQSESTLHYRLPALIQNNYEVNTADRSGRASNRSHRTNSSPIQVILQNKERIHTVITACGGDSSPNIANHVLD